MNHKYHEGDIVYHISNSIFVRKAVVLRSSGDFYTIRFEDNGSGIRVRESKLFRTKAEAEKKVFEIKQKQVDNSTKLYW